jgi:hypothetical protein
VVWFGKVFDDVGPRVGLAGIFDWRRERGRGALNVAFQTAVSFPVSEPWLSIAKIRGMASRMIDA